MLLDPRDWALASRIDEVLPALPARRRRPRRAGDARLGARAREPAARDGRATRSPSWRTCAPGSPPRWRRSSCAPPSAARIRSRSGARSRSRPGARYRSIYDSMRELARREPTFALHVHVAVPDAESAVRALRGLRVHVPLLLALAANSPFWQGRDTGLAVRPRADLRDVPARRHPAQVRQLRRVRRGGRRAAALRRVPGADVPVVGRAAAAQAGHDRGADHGRADARRPTTPRSSRSCSARCGSRRPRATSTRRSRRGPRCSTRTASSRRATGCGRSSSIRARDLPPGARHPRRAARGVRAARRRAGLRGRAGRRRRRSPPSPATTASGCSRAFSRATRSARASACW